MVQASSPLLSVSCLRLIAEPAVPSRPRVETEREKELVQQLKQTSEKTTRLQEELRQAIETERQLQMQLDDLKEEFKPDKEVHRHDSMDKFYVSIVFQN